MPKNPKAFTLVELLVVIGIIGIIIAFLLPALNRSRMAAQTAGCLSNLRQLDTAFLQYVTDNKGHSFPYYYEESPAQVEWQIILLPYLIPSVNKYDLYNANVTTLEADVQKLSSVALNVYLCPAANQVAPANYVGNVGSGTAFFCWGLYQGEGQATGGLDGSYSINGWLYRLDAGGDDVSLLGTEPKWSGYAGPFTNSSGNVVSSAFEFWQLPEAGTSSSSIPILADSIWVDGWPKETDSSSSINLYLGSMASGMERMCISRHNKGKYVNVAYLDGHAETNSLKSLWNINWHKYWNQNPQQKVKTPAPNP